MKRINPLALRQFVSRLYMALGLNEDKASLLSDSLVMADLWGHSSHGVLRATWYAERIQHHVMDINTDPEITSDTGPLLALDGHNGLGQFITREAVRLAIARAQQFGIGCVSIRRSGHFGTAMYFTKTIAEQNMIGFLATNASPAMAAFGGREKIVGNNPQSWAAPTPFDAPFIVDIAHTAVARGKIYLAKEKRETIPDHWALSPQGQATTDPAEAILGTLMPMAGHKGFALSAMMDVLSGVLSGGAFGQAINGPYVPDQASGVGHFLMVVDIAKLREVDAFKDDMGAMINAWKNSQKAEGVSEIFYPGEKEERHRLKAIAEGLALAADTLDRLIPFAHHLGVNITLDDLLFHA
jgi:LDH2 family malate/lactate/ureidoglycolate dehydrogenase